MTVENTGFDNEKYLKDQSKSILDRAAQFGNKLYLEFGGKLVYDYHASRQYNRLSARLLGSRLFDVYICNDSALAAVHRIYLAVGGLRPTLETSDNASVLSFSDGCRVYHPSDPLEHAGSHQAGLYTYGTFKGFTRKKGHYHSYAQKRPASYNHTFRHSSFSYDRRFHVR